MGLSGIALPMGGSHLSESLGGSEREREREKNNGAHWWNLFSVILFYLCKIFRKGTQKFKIK